MPSPALLVSLDQLKNQLRVTHNHEDSDIYDKLADAEDIIVRYLGAQFDEDWDEDTVPGAVRAAILRHATYLWTHRGDEDGGVSGMDDHGLAPGVRAGLSFYRDPIIA